MTIHILNKSRRTIGKGSDVNAALNSIKTADDWPYVAIMYDGPEIGFSMVDRGILYRKGVRNFLISGETIISSS